MPASIFRKTRSYPRRHIAPSSVTAAPRSTNMSGESAGIDAATVVDAVEVLFAGFASGVAEETVAVFEMLEPIGASALMLSVNVTVADAPLARAPSEHVTVDVPL